jgi:phenylacetate-CoA ligase
MNLKQNIHEWYHRYIARNDLYALYDFANNFQYLDPHEINRWQNKRLQELVKHASKNVPYYKGVFEKQNLDPDNFTIADFQKLPFLTKEIIRNKTEELKAENLPKSRFIKNSTSGSTGSNLVFYSDNGTRIRQAINIRCNEWMGKFKDQKEMVIWGAAFDVKRSRGFMSWIKKKLASLILLSGYRLSDKDIKDYAKTIEDFKPYLLTSYPSILYAFSKWIEDNNLKWKPTAIKSAGEKLFPFQREAIEKAFGAKIYDFYGARDIPMVAMQCGHDSGLHIMAENVYLEVIDENGNPIDDGEGELVLTDLHNMVFPFIRYKIGDRARISKRRCSCGRTLPILEEVLGRTFDILEFPNGNRVGGSFWTLVSRSVDGIKDFQVIQKSKNTIEFKIILREGTTQIDEIVLISHIKKYSGDDLNIQITYTNEIEPTKGGKHQFVISQI